MDTEPMVIKLKENYIPKAITVPRKVPYARREDEIKEMRKLEQDGIIEQVGDRPTEFCSPKASPLKPDGSIRLEMGGPPTCNQSLRRSKGFVTYSTLCFSTSLVKSLESISSIVSLNVKEFIEKLLGFASS